MVRRSKNKRPGSQKPGSLAGKSTSPSRENTQSKPKGSGETMLDSPAKSKDSGDKSESPGGKSSGSGCEDSHTGERPESPVAKSSDHDGENARYKQSGHVITGSSAGKSSETGHESIPGTAGSVNEVRLTCSSSNGLLDTDPISRKSPPTKGTPIFRIGRAQEEPQSQRTLLRVLFPHFPASCPFHPRTSQGSRTRMK